MGEVSTLVQWVISVLLILSAIGVLAAEKSVHASLSFLLTLVLLAAAYAVLSAGFIAAMQIWVYAGAILVIFIFVIVLFQDAYSSIARHPPKSSSLLWTAALFTFVAAGVSVLDKLFDHLPAAAPIQADYGSVQALGALLYLDFFFPFEALTLLFLAAVVGSLYMAKRGKY